jgi:hypothetical protein
MPDRKETNIGCRVPKGKSPYALCQPVMLQNPSFPSFFLEISEAGQ